MELGGLPLALEQAAAYMQATGDSIAGYLELFRQRRLELLTRGNPTGYDKQVTTTWRAGASTSSSRPPRGCAGCCGCWPAARPEPIPLDRLLQPRPGLAERFGGGGACTSAASGGPAGSE